VDHDERELALERLHILDAIGIACERRSELIDLIDTSASAEHAVGQLRQTFGFDEVQARAVLDLQIRRLARLERTRIAEEREVLRREAGLG